MEYRRYTITEEPGDEYSEVYFIVRNARGAYMGRTNTLEEAKKLIDAWYA